MPITSKMKLPETVKSGTRILPSRRTFKALFWIILVCILLLKVFGFGSKTVTVVPIPSKNNSHSLEEVKSTNPIDLIDDNGNIIHTAVMNYLRSKHLFQYNSSLPTDYTTSLKSHKGWRQIMSKFILRRLNFMRDGFFVECGAFDGAFLSNSLLLEEKYGWSGLLVEADPVPLELLKKRNRRAYVADVCMSTLPQPMQVEMTGHINVIGHGYIKNEVIERSRETKDAHFYPRKFQVQCFPFEMLLDAVNRTEIDYFSLDVEGVELDVLKTIPWNKFRIKIISVEIRPKNKKKVRKYLQSVGYEKLEEVAIRSEFIHDDLYALRNLPQII